MNSAGGRCALGSAAAALLLLVVYAALHTIEVSGASRRLEGNGRDRYALVKANGQNQTHVNVGRRELLLRKWAKQAGALS